MRGLTIPDGNVDSGRWPFTIPAIRHVVEHGLALDSGVTVLLGANGSGKSTLVEALAGAWGRRISAFRDDWLQQTAALPSGEDSDLWRVVRLDCSAGGPTGGLFLRAELVHAQASWFSGRGRWGKRMDRIDLLARSHGEGFLEVLAAMVADPGLYILDEPESALSFDSCLVLLALMIDMCAAGSQIVLATHSPVLAAMPDALLLQLDETGIHSVSFDDSDLVTSWRAFLQSPDHFLRHLR